MSFNSVLTKETDCPECFKKHTDMAYRYVDIYGNGVVVGHVALGIVDEKCILHAVVEKWTKESLKALKTGYFSIIVPGLKELGVKEIGFLELADSPGLKKLMKFAKIFHFSKPRYLMYSSMEI